MTEDMTPVLSSDALWGKSKKYITRALAAKQRSDNGEYQLWASLALELLGKASLAKIHPCLIADPQSSVSMFAAAGKNIGANVKTIIAKTVFERLSHISTRFDKTTHDFCIDLSLKRNSELHSGEAPFETSVPSAWEGRYWHSVEIILESMGQTIEKWLGANRARAPKELLQEYKHAVGTAAKIRVEMAAGAFQKLPKKEREAAHDRAKQMSRWEVRLAFGNVHAVIWDEVCPACDSRAFTAGVPIFEEVSEEDVETNEETVDITLGAEEFRCPSCELYLQNRDEIEAVNLSTENVITETRQREYEPEYGND